MHCSFTNCPSLGLHPNKRGLAIRSILIAPESNMNKQQQTRLFGHNVITIMAWTAQLFYFSCDGVPIPPHSNVKDFTAVAETQSRHRYVQQTHMLGFCRSSSLKCFLTTCLRACESISPPMRVPDCFAFAPRCGRQQHVLWFFVFICAAVLCFCSCRLTRRAPSLGRVAGIFSRGVVSLPISRIFRWLEAFSLHICSHKCIYVHIYAYMFA